MSEMRFRILKFSTTLPKKMILSIRGKNAVNTDNIQIQTGRATILAYCQ